MPMPHQPERKRKGKKIQLGRIKSHETDLKPHCFVCLTFWIREANGFRGESSLNISFIFLRHKMR